MLTKNESQFARPPNGGKTRPCEGCGNSDPWARHSKKESMTGKYYEECNRCFDSSVSGYADVYWNSKRGPYWSEELYDPDDPASDRIRGMTLVTSKAHKTYLMKKLGRREAGDRILGSRNFDPISYKYAMQSLRRPHENVRHQQNNAH